MSGSFSADWLTLRETADDRARSVPVIEAAVAFLQDQPLTGGARLQITDLGAGTGATVRAVAPRLPGPQDWRLIDNDAALLAAAEARLAQHMVAPRGPVHSITPHVVDLALNASPWTGNTHLVTCSAFFDLVSLAWLDRFAGALAGDGIALLAFLTYDGRLDLHPAHTDDVAMVEAFNAHQRVDKGFGPAAGPDATSALVGRLEERGYRCTLGASAWQLSRASDGAMIDEILRGWAGAAREIDALPEARIAAWLDARLADTDTLVVGHQDIFAAPGA